MTSAAPLMTEQAEAARTGLLNRLKQQERLRQYFTSAPIARMMSSMMDYPVGEIALLDPGAGVGSLFSACLDEICSIPAELRPQRVSVTAYELDRSLLGHLEAALETARRRCADLGIDLTYDLRNEDFIAQCSSIDRADARRFTHAIINPPYGKIRLRSDMYEALLDAGLPATNMYAAFIDMSARMLRDGGQMTFISPRSFCNGSYFERFRKSFLGSMRLRRIHLFGSRTKSFRDDGVLQENVIVCAHKGGPRRNVGVSASTGPGEPMTMRRSSYSDVVLPDDPGHFIHIIPDEAGLIASRTARSLTHTLAGLGIEVSTGRVVDFRIRGELRFEKDDGAVPLVRPFNMCDGGIRFPVRHKKHQNFIMSNTASERQLVANGNYVLVKRFTTVEQERRVVASVWTPDMHDSDRVGFENRVNYFHGAGGGLDVDVARGLCVFLNSTLVDTYFRQYNGSTQVNAADLRYLRYPSPAQLRALGGAADSSTQAEIDGLVEAMAGGMVVRH